MTMCEPQKSEKVYFENFTHHNLRKTFLQLQRLKICTYVILTAICDIKDLDD